MKKEGSGLKNGRALRIHGVDFPYNLQRNYTFKNQRVQMEETILSAKGIKIHKECLLQT